MILTRITSLYIIWDSKSAITLCTRIRGSHRSELHRKAVVVLVVTKISSISSLSIYKYERMEKKQREREYHHTIGAKMSQLCYRFHNRIELTKTGNSKEKVKSNKEMPVWPSMASFLERKKKKKGTIMWHRHGAKMKGGRKARPDEELIRESNR